MYVSFFLIFIFGLLYFIVGFCKGHSRLLGRDGVKIVFLDVFNFIGCFCQEIK